MPAYDPQFRVGARVRTISADELRAFQTGWQLHHPLTAEQMAFGDVESVVAEIGYYHGGDVLYHLKDVPGVWHEQCLVGLQDKK
jgi:hypothetical protein